MLRATEIVSEEAVVTPGKRVLQAGSAIHASTTEAWRVLSAIG